jgi:demethylmenaquinone methyltransferase/2-methoxy-6-polyprenyl-1,4-benzoquinol methylase
MFDRIVDRYDLLNDVLSLGMDRWWRRTAAAAVDVAPGVRVLDLGCGTGKLGLRLAGRARVVGVDVSSAMLSRARETSRGRVAFVQGSAFRLPFINGAFGGAVSGFVLRNLSDLPGAFSELGRVVAPGGRIALVDATEPSNPAYRWLFDTYFGTMAPALGRLVGRRDAYRYLVGSLAQIPPAPQVCTLLGNAGFAECRARGLTGGVATLFTAVRTDVVPRAEGYPPGRIETGLPSCHDRSGWAWRPAARCRT